jgi:septum formation protein
MVDRRFVLASSSRSRLSILKSAGFDPEVIVSGVDETSDELDTGLLVLELAIRKSRAVAEGLRDAIVVGCDSLLDLDGTGLGKPATIDQARHNWKQLSGRTATLMTGHCVIIRPSDAMAVRVVKTEVTFGNPTSTELDTYLGTGESLFAAGGFTLEGMSAPFIENIAGDALNVMGVSPATVRSLLYELGIALVEVWPTRTMS